MTIESTEVWFYAAAALIVIAAMLAAAALTPRPGVASERGERGYQRQRARRSPAFSALEPALRLAAGAVAVIPLGDLRGLIDGKLRGAGDPLGLSPDELLAGSIIIGTAAGSLGYQLFPEPLIALGVGLGACILPIAALSGRKQERDREVTRELPAAIDLLALCISAGMDFPGALREVVGDDPDSDDVLRAELRKVLRDLDLGHPRKQALQALAARTGGEGVADFVAAVIQSEEKGNPLKETLEAQAHVLRLRRSFRAEVLAAQAGVKMALPLALLLLIVLVLVGAPLIFTMQEGGL